MSIIISNSHYVVKTSVFIKLSGPNYLINRTTGYFSWAKGNMKIRATLRVA